MDLNTAGTCVEMCTGEALTGRSLCILGLAIDKIAVGFESNSKPEILHYSNPYNAITAREH